MVETPTQQILKLEVYYIDTNHDVGNKLTLFRIEGMWHRVVPVEKEMLLTRPRPATYLFQ